MFEVVGSDIERLSDAELRSLVLRLASSELRKQGLPISAVTAGGHQDAPDGGLDVRVACSVAMARADFVPRANTGFQVKKPDMAAGAIRKEMCPKGALRPAIAELAQLQGAYIIVSAQGSVADKPLQERREAMRAQLTSLASPTDLYVDFYDRDRIAAWVNEYPGVAAWVRSVAGRALNGWTSIYRLSSNKTTTAFLADGSTCLLDESRKPGQALEILSGVERLRDELRRHGRCVRLIGLSGVGKTRLVQALFEDSVGTEPLDPSIAIYTDYSTETRPSARDMACDLINRGEPAILIVDNCNPETHSELAKICSESGAPISLLTVEYDVREDEPERTDVFRLKGASSDLIEKWIEQNFGHISEVDRRTIAAFSDGNFRIANALAETLGRGETLGKVKSRDLIQRIFRQRNVEDGSLQMAAEDLSLAYSVDGEDISAESELAQIAEMRGVDARSLYQVIVELRQRNVVQARGRWRAILPQAIANGLASTAVARTHQDTLDNLIRLATPRLRASISRRLGYLHDVPEARAAAARWLRSDGAFGDLFNPATQDLRIITNLAPLAPGDAMDRISEAVQIYPEIADCGSRKRWEWIRLIKALSYETEHFNSAAQLLMQFIATEPTGNQVDSAREAFSEMFQLYLSGTQASPETRRALVANLLGSDDEDSRACGLLALQALLKTSYFSSSTSFDFGARSRSWGWHPQSSSDVCDWYVRAIRLCVHLSDRIDEPRQILAQSVRGLWRYEACHGALEDAAEALLKRAHWIDGWISLRATLRFDGKKMPREYRTRLEALIDRLQPVDLLDRARAAVLGRGVDGLEASSAEADDESGMHAWKRASLMAQGVGRELALAPSVRQVFMSELMVATDVQRAYECGMGLAEGAPTLLETWELLLSDYERADAARRDATVLGGFLRQAKELDAEFTEGALESSLSRGSLIPIQPYLQARVGLDQVGISRMRRALAAGLLEAPAFVHIANGLVEHSPPALLAALLADIARLASGEWVALEILHMYFFSNKSTSSTAPRALVEVGQGILASLKFKSASVQRVHSAGEVAKICCSTSDPEPARSVAESLCLSLEAGDIHFHEVREIINALCEAHPHVMLDTFLLRASEDSLGRRWDTGGSKGLAYRSMGLQAIQSWASINAVHRYPLLGAVMWLFSRGDFEEGTKIDPIFEGLLRGAPDRVMFLGKFDRQVYPLRWNGSIKDMLRNRRSELTRLAAEMPGEVADWVHCGLPLIERWIANAIETEHHQEEAFE